MGGSWLLSKAGVRNQGGLNSSVLSEQMKVISMTTIQLAHVVKFSVREHQRMIAKRNPRRIGLGGGEGERKCPSGVPPAVPGCGHTPLIGRLTPAPWRRASREKGGV